MPSKESWEKRLDRLLKTSDVQKYMRDRRKEVEKDVKKSESDDDKWFKEPLTPWKWSMFDHDDWWVYCCNGNVIDNPSWNKIRLIIAREFAGNPKSVCTYFEEECYDKSEAKSRIDDYLDALEDGRYTHCWAVENEIIGNEANAVTYELFEGGRIEVPCDGRLEFRADAPPEPGEDANFDAMVREWETENAGTSRLGNIRSRVGRRKK